MPEHDRDRSVERLLRHALAGETTTFTPDVCVDGETLAAWSAGTLRPEQVSGVDAHIADCGRCQALLATLVRATPPARATEPLWHRWRLPWLVPLATAATAAALWFAIPGRTPEPVEPAPPRQLAVRRDAPALPEASATPSEALAGGRLEPQTPASTPPSETATGRAQADAFLEDRRAGGAPPPASKLESTSPESRVPTPEPGSQGNFRSDARERVAETDAAAEKGIAETAFAVSAARQAGSLVEFAAPGSAARWRITAERRVERSTTGGALWEATAVPTTDALTAGSAPSASVCWIVGRGGVIYLTTDGTEFVRVPFPEAIDLVGITATDDRSAIVTAADGRSWRTRDQGGNWMRLAL